MWQNLGDKNYLEYGGCLVKPAYNEKELKEYPDLSGYYNVFWLNTDTSDEDEVLAALLLVNVDDYINNDRDRHKILQAIGLEEEPDPLTVMSRAEWAREIVNFYSIEDFSPTVLKENCYYPSEYEHFLCKREDVKNWLIQLGAGEIIK